MLLQFFLLAGCQTFKSHNSQSLAEQVRKEINYQEKGEICQHSYEAPINTRPLCYEISEKKPFLEKIEEKAGLIEKTAAKVRKTAKKTRELQEKITGKASQYRQRLRKRREEAGRKTSDLKDKAEQDAKNNI